jgi:UDP-N-acetyl-D-mannosaminuronic acid transferase (WecB/TagA/CpsF family)
LCFLVSPFSFLLSPVRILGLDFFEGTAAEAVDRALDRAGLIVAPSGTCFTRLQQDPIYRDAMTKADQVLPDSGFMVLLWRLLRGDPIRRISGLAYLNELFKRPNLRSGEATIWVLPNQEAQETTMSWLRDHGFPTAPENFYVAPIYGSPVEDSVLLEKIRSQQPRHVIIALSGGIQEKLGSYLHHSAGYSLAIHCIGGALGFIAGYQTAISPWADRFYLGWFMRLIADPRVFLPRLWEARSLPNLISKYGPELPPLRTPV